MKHFGYCAGAFGFFAATFFTMLSNGELHKEYASQLTKRQLDIYRDIKMERFRIWVKATIASFVFAVFLSRFLEDKDAHMRTCFMVFVFFLIQYLIYTIHPKKQYMLQYIENQKQSKAWLKVYKTMQLKYHLGFVLGIVAFALFSLFLSYNQ